MARKKRIGERVARNTSRQFNLGYVISHRDASSLFAFLRVASPSTSLFLVHHSPFTIDH